jgi:hypothetical protein
MVMVNSANAAEKAEVRPITAALAAPFEPKEVRFKPQMVKNNRALALPYVDARVVQDRLDEVLGVEGWQDEYQLLPDGSVSCKLRLLIGGQWITKMDVGSPSEQPDGGDRLKAAFSDALKRAAVKFGVGRYLYRLQSQWVDYDPVKKQFTQTPQLPAFALPQQKKPDAQPARGSAAKAQPDGLPADGAELHRRLRDYDAKLAAQKLCAVGAVLSHVAAEGARAGYGEDITAWAGPAIPFAAEVVKAYEATLRRQAKARPQGSAA